MEYEGLEVRAPSPLPAVVVHSMLTHYGSVSGRGLYDGDVLVVFSFYWESGRGSEGQVSLCVLVGVGTVLVTDASKEAKKDKKGKKGKRGDGDDDGLPTELIETVKARRHLGVMEPRLDVADLVLVVEGVVFVDELVRELGLATDAELNSFMSLKKLAPYRQDSAAYRSKQAQNGVMEPRLDVADLVLVVEGVVFVDELVRELGSLRVEKTTRTSPWRRRQRRRRRTRRARRANAETATTTVSRPS
jgi:phage antirepressor YoqD-like protein